MPGEMQTNVNTVCEQAITPNPMYRISLRCAAAQNNGVYKGDINTVSQVQVDNNNRIIKFTQWENRHRFPYGKEVIINKVATIFNYNENGDIIQQIRDYGDDGKYERVYDFNCVYDENNNLISHEETMWSKIKNGFKNFYDNELLFD